ncbi:MAG: transporter substrate-binding domain-containing protein [Steroidobacteraceae bacterium]|jgi:membrane-bound lytic murein transglycosylase MltF
MKAVAVLGIALILAAPRGAAPRGAAPLAASDRAADAGPAASGQLSIELKATVWSGDLGVMAAHRAIRVLVPYSKTLYFVDYGGAQRGISFDFMRAFEDELNKKLNRGDLRIHAVFIPVSRDQLIPMLVAGKGDVVAANLTVTPERSRLVNFVVPAATGVKEVIVTGPGAPVLRSLDDLAGQTVYVQPGTSYYQSLLALNDRLRLRRLAPVRLRDAPGRFETEDLLEMANAGLVPIVVADDYLAHFWRQVYPNLSVHDDLQLRTEGDIAFAVRKDSPQLKAELDAFTVSHRQGTLFGNITLRKYLQQTRWAKNAISEAEMRKFNAMVSSFRKYGEQYRINWLLMAAQGYQESQLDQTRRSDAGAIGVMQLMPATGKAMQVGDITELDANIHAGVKYVRFMVDTYYKDESMDALNKVLFAFASYNAGPDRIRSLRREAAALKLDPNLWFDNVERVAATHIGRETVQYVSNIYKYYIAYSLVQDEVEKSLKAAGASAKRS